MSLTPASSSCSLGAPEAFRCFAGVYSLCYLHSSYTRPETFHRKASWKISIGLQLADFPCEGELGASQSRDGEDSPRQPCTIWVFRRKALQSFVPNQPSNYIQTGSFHCLCTVPMFSSSAGRVVPACSEVEIQVDGWMYCGTTRFHGRDWTLCACTPAINVLFLITTIFASEFLFPN